MIKSQLLFLHLIIFQSSLVLFNCDAFNISFDQPSLIFSGQSQFSPRGVIINDSCYLIIWSGTNFNSPSSLQVYGAIFSNTSISLVPPFQVSLPNPPLNLTGNQENPAAAMISTDQYIIVWSGQDGTFAYYQIYAAILDTSGNIINGSFVISSNNPFYTFSMNQEAPTVSSLQNEQVLVTWMGSTKALPKTQIYSIILNVNANTIRGPFLITNDTLNFSFSNFNQMFPSSTIMNSTQNFMITWQGEGNIGNSEILAMKIDIYGNLVFGPIIISQGVQFKGFPQRNPNIANIQNDESFITWSGQSITEFNFEIFAAIIKGNGNFIVQPFVPINNKSIIFTGFDQMNPKLATSPIWNCILITWNGMSQNDTKNQTYGVVLNMTGNSVNEPFWVTKNETDWTQFPQENPSAVVSTTGQVLEIWQQETLSEKQIQGEFIQMEQCIVSNNTSTPIISATISSNLTISNLTITPILFNSSSNYEIYQSTRNLICDQDTIFGIKNNFALPVNVESWTVDPSFIRLIPLSNGEVIISEFDSTSNQFEGLGQQIMLEAYIFNNSERILIERQVSQMDIFTIAILPINSIAQGLASSIKIFGLINLVIAILVIILGNQSQILEIQRSILYMLFFNVNYPQQLNEVLVSLASQKLDIIPNLFQIDTFLLNFQSNSIESPEKFNNHNFDALFLLTAGSNIFMLLYSILFGAIAWIILWKFDKIHPPLKKILDQMRSNVTKEGFLALWVQLSAQFVLASMLQLTNPHFDTGLRVISYLIALFTFLMHFFILYLFLRKLQTTIRAYPQKLEGRVSEYMHTLKKSTQLVLIPVPFIYSLRSTLIGILIVVSYPLPVLQSLLISLICLALTIFVIWKLPWKSKFSNLVHIIQEMSLSLIYLFILSMAISQINGKMDYNSRSTLGYLIIVLIIFIIILQAIYNIYQMIKHYRHNFHLKRKPKRIKVSTRKIKRKSRGDKTEEIKE